MRSTAGWLTSDQLDRVRRRLAVAGVLALVLGFVSIAVPAVTSVAISVLVGWILVDGRRRPWLGVSRRS